jgi:hypothetical protein
MSRGVALQRVVVAILAAAAFAWFAITYDDAQKIAHVDRLVKEPLPPRASLEAALRDLRGWDSLNPDTIEPLSYRAVIYIRLGLARTVQDTLLRVVRREPQNAESWSLLGVVSRRIDPALSARAFAKVRELDPIDARPRSP